MTEATTAYLAPILQAAALLELRVHEIEVERLGAVLDKLSPRGFQKDVLPPVEALRLLGGTTGGTVEELELLDKVWPDGSGDKRYKLTATTLTWQYSPKHAGSYTTIKVPFPTILPMLVEVERWCDMDEGANHADECDGEAEDCNCEGWVEAVMLATVTEWNDQASAQLADWLERAIREDVTDATFPATKKKAKKDDTTTVCVDQKRAIKLFTDWHVDEVTERKEARDYAKRLWARLVEECRVIGGDK